MILRKEIFKEIRNEELNIKKQKRRCMIACEMYIIESYDFSYNHTIMLVK